MFAGTTTWQGGFPPTSSRRTLFSMWPGGVKPSSSHRTSCAVQHGNEATHHSNGTTTHMSPILSLAWNWMRDVFLWPLHYPRSKHMTETARPIWQRYNPLQQHSNNTSISLPCSKCETEGIFYFWLHPEPLPDVICTMMAGISRTPANLFYFFLLNSHHCCQQQPY